jgi:hypothetical protein
MIKFHWFYFHTASYPSNINVSHFSMSTMMFRLEYDERTVLVLQVGLPSSATTDSNNSNDTGGTPTSTTSGNSPAPSPPLNALHNHSSDSSNEDKKKTKDDLPTKVEL